MKKLDFYGVVATVLLAVGLSGCRNDIDLNNIDTKMQLNTALAVPVGNVTVRMGDFLGNGQVPLIKVDEQGIFHAIDTFQITTKEYHKIDLNQYIVQNAAQLSFRIADKMPTGTIVGDGTTRMSMTFPLQLSLTGINTDMDNERLDSMIITNARFISKIGIENLDLRWNEIKNVTLTLGDQFTRAAGKEINIPISGKNFTNEIPTDIEDFTLCLMADRNNPGQVVNKINFDLSFELCLDNGHSVTISDESNFLYDLKVELSDYAALWGYFEPSTEMSDADHMSMDDIWAGWQDVKKLKMRFMEPKVSIYMRHHVAAPLMMVIDYVKAVNAAGGIADAQWTDAGTTSSSKTIYFNYFIFPTDPLETEKEYHAVFDQQPANGHFDRLFDIRPDSFIYSFHLEVDKNKLGTSVYPYRQLRITKDRQVPGYGIFDIPFKFNTQSEAEYITTFETDWHNIHFDSIAKQNDNIDTLVIKRALAFITVYNSIPFEINGKFHFLDKDTVDLNLKFIQGNDSNIVHIAAPEMRGFNDQYGQVSKPSETLFTLDVDSAEFRRLQEVKYVQLDAFLGNNPMMCRVDTATCLKVQLGLGADVEAIVNFNKKEGGAQ